MAEIQILLATYDSSRFLSGQLDSVLAQTRRDFEVLIRDGGSADATPKIIGEYVRRYPDRIKFIGAGPASASENFSALLAVSTSPLVMFCDHDDVWKPDKVAATVEKYREMEARFGRETPMLIFTDSEVTDQDLNRISPSMLKFQHLDPHRLTLNRMIAQNVPSGNTMLLNRALADLARPIPPEAVMYDHWITLVAAGMGRIGFLDEPTLLYRQHGGNVYGAHRYSAAAVADKLRRGVGEFRAAFARNMAQAAVFGRRYADVLSAADRAMLADLDEWPKLGSFARKRLLLKYHICKSGFLRNIGTFLFA